MSQAYRAYAPLEVPGDVLDALAAGGGGPRAWALLRAARRSRNLLLLRGLYERARAATPDEALPFLDAGLALLRTVQTRAPAVFTQVMDDPMTGAWLGCWARNAPLSAPATHAAPLAASAALRAGLPFRITVPAHAGEVVLPALGLASLPGTKDTAEVAYEAGDVAGRVVGGGAYVRVRVPVRVESGATGPERGAATGPATGTPPGAGATTGPPGSAAGERARDEDVPGGHDRPGATGWHPLPRLDCTAEGRTWAPQLDSLNPFRVGHRPVAARVLDAAEAGQWQAELGGAWRILVERHPERADEIREFQRSIVPLGGEAPTVDGRGGWISATLGDAVGHVALAPHPGARALAAGLVHETQHSKLCALLDVVDLLDVPPGARCYSPWREDPRPPSGLLQGAYAFLAVTGFWSTERARRTDSDGEPAARFALRYEQVRGALAELAGSSWPTGEGRRFVDVMARTLAAWAGTAPGPRTLGATAEHRMRWRLRHAPEPPPAAVRTLAAAYAQGRPAPPLPPGPGVLAPDPWAPPAAPPPPGAARTAAELDALLSTPGTGGPEEWARLGTAALLHGDDRAPALAATPELVRAVHTSLATPCSPLDLAQWLRPALPHEPEPPAP